MAAEISSSPTKALLAQAEKISQGAEAKVYRARLHPSPSQAGATHASAGLEDVLLKHRFHKQYRHPTLDTTLTKSRVAGEARALLKCIRSGVNVPGIRMVDAPEGVLGIEWIDGKSVRFLLGGGAEGEEEVEEGAEDAEDEEEVEEDLLHEFGVTQDAVMELIGTEIAKMHQADIVHGDLTTSNMMLRHPSSPQGLQLVLIDFGLAFTSTLVEDKAVDLYVLERAFASTHPQSEPLFAGVLKAYEKKMGKEWTAISRRLDDVRLRGRKRSMVG
ncbi:kinase-like domain-containing protein [Lenzites betulinus]|nr:kinase-like domain-containing protein [Lenzites betulinus]